jgi:hypothetical protein
MATYNKYQDFVEQLCKAVHNFDGAGHVFKIYLSNIAPTATDTSKPGSATEFTPGGTGYTAGGEDVLNTIAEAGGTATVTATKVVWTAATSTWNPFRYVVLYNDSATSPADALVAWWDYGVGGVTLGVGETFSVKWNGSDTTGTVFTLT